MYQVMIADDELIIREGLRCIIDWEELGFEIATEASNGEEALQKIIETQPDLVMLDIRMPKLLGVDVIRQAREQGFNGQFIILSGYTDFEYTQAAIQYNVAYYLTKPIDEDELCETVKKIREDLDTTKTQAAIYDHYKDKMQSIILSDLLTGNVDMSHFKDSNLLPEAEQYQVVIYEKYSHNAERSSYRFSDLLKVTNEDNTSYDSITLDNNNIILLKGTFILQKFQDFLSRYEQEQRPQMNSPLDSLFITYGHAVSEISEIHESYEEALLLLQRRFFCNRHQHTIGYEDLPSNPSRKVFKIDSTALNKYQESLTDLLQVNKRSQISQVLQELETNLYYCTEPIQDVKLFLTDLYLSVKEKLFHLYHNTDLPFPRNSEIINQINSYYYLYEIIQYFEEQFKMVTKAITHPSSENVMDDILHYIEHNYMDNIKLETIAPLFGYNSSYLGKIFSKKVGVGFNVFIDEVRIKHSKDLLINTELKVYEIAEKVGYRNVDYFHTKFKKYVNQSPAEFRKTNKNTEN